MSGDNRSVATDALATLGTIIDESVGRDAIHLAVEPVVARERLYPGQNVGFIGDPQNREVGGSGKAAVPLGIVDPFLRAPVEPGQRFWLVVYPRQITSLRHVWTHPAFPEVINEKKNNKTDAEVWLREFLGSGDPTYEEVMERARIGDNVTFYGHDIDYKNIPDEFYDHLETLTGRRFEDRPTYFSCAC